MPRQPVDHTTSPIGAIVVGLVVAAALLFWRQGYEAFELPKAALVVVGTVTCVALALWFAVERGALAIPRHPVVLIALTFFAALLVAVIASDSTATSVLGTHRRYTGLLFYGSMVLLFVLAASSFGERHVRLLLRALAAAGGVMAAYALLQWVGADPYEWRGASGGAAFSTLGNSNFAAAYLGMALPAAVWVAVSDASRRVRLAAAGAALACAVGLAATRSAQGPIVGAVAAAVLAIALLRARGGRAARMAAVAGTAAIVVALAVVGLALAGVGPGAEVATERNIQLRKHYWSAAAAMFSDQPVAGVGLDRYAANYRGYRSESAASAVNLDNTADHPHNVPLDMFAEGGLLLGLPYLAFVGAIGVILVRGLLRLSGERAVMLGGVGAVWAGYQAQSLVSIDVAALAIVHWVTAAAILVIASPPEIAWFELPVVSRRGGGSRRRRQQLTTGDMVFGGALALVVLATVVVASRHLGADAAIAKSRAARAADARDAAVSFGETATSRAPAVAKYWFEYARALVEDGDDERAMESLERGLEIDPKSFEQVIMAARLAKAMKQEEAMLAYYDRLAALDPHAALTVSEAAREHSAAGSEERAVELAEQAARLDSDEPSVWLRLGAVFSRADRADDARTAYEKVLSLDPDNEDAKARLADLEKKAK